MELKVQTFNSKTFVEV